MMKRLLLIVMATISVVANAQLLKFQDEVPHPNDSLTIFMKTSHGNQGLLNHNSDDVYVHTGVITNLSTSPTDWRYVKFNQNFNTPNSQLKALHLGNGEYRFRISPSIRNYYGVPAGETILKIAILFRSGNGSKVQRNYDGSDMYIPVYSVHDVRIDVPYSHPKFIPEPEAQNWVMGSVFSIQAYTNRNAHMKLYHNGVLVASSTGLATNLSGTSTVTTLGNQQLVAESENNSNIVYDTLNIFVPPPAPEIAPLPEGVADGINYEPGDTSVTLVLRAPGKDNVMLIGDFNNWTQSIDHIMKKTPDGNFFWLRLHPLTPGTEYAYQYLIDNELKIADPYAEKLLDPFQDQYITDATYPNLKPYPAGQSEIVSVLQTDKPEYNWAVTSFNRPDKRGLVIYELLVRDFVAAHDWATVMDSLDYLKKLGVNAIEIMPFNEFEGNLSWGYNSSFYFAPDKYYGTENSLKRFIDSCHSKGMAVIMDIALNHSFGQSPMVRMYWDDNANRPAANNPWFNPVPKHAFNVGYDFNHSSSHTRYFTSRVVEHWLQEYKIDGFRFDLSKGFTQTQTCDNNGGNCNVGAWGNYDASRVALWKAYYDTVQLKSDDAYVILEHFADNQEEIELSNYGMLLWGNLNHSYNQALMGHTQDWDFSGVVHSARNWSNPHLVGYMESHDEERLMYRNINFGNSFGSYNTKDTATALKRMEMGAAFFFTIPGPKMIWQFGELGYDFPINYCPDGTVNNNCRTDNKPIRWDYLSDPRRKNLYNVYSKLINLRHHSWYRQAFLSGTVERNLSGQVKTLRINSGDTSHLVVIGNFGLNTSAASVTFPVSGTWFDYLRNTTYTATGGQQSISLQPGEYRVFVNRNVNNLSVTPVIDVPGSGSSLYAKVFPNPVQSGACEVEIDMPQSGNIAIEMYSITGQHIRTIKNGFMTKGKHSLTINNLVPGGNYYLNLKTRKETKTIPLIIQ